MVQFVLTFHLPQFLLYICIIKDFTGRLIPCHWTLTLFWKFILFSESIEPDKEAVAILRKRPITRCLSSEHNFLYNKNIKEGMEEDKMSKQIVPLNVDYSSKKEGKSNAIILKLRKGKMEWVLYDSLDKEQLKLILELVMHHVDSVK